VTDTRRKVLVATADTLGPRMAGPAIRAWHIAEALAGEHEVRLVTTGVCRVESDALAVRSVDEVGLRLAVEWCDVVIVQGWILAGRPHISHSDKVIVCDIYDPMHLEQLEQARDAGGDTWRHAVHGATAALNDQLLRGDFFVCASEKQRDFWLGQLAALGRVNPATYSQDGTLRRLIDVVPFGTGDEPPHAERSAIRGALPGVDETSKVILWGGGIYNWFDPLTLIRAVHAVHGRHPEVRLVFMGLTHPNPEIPQMRVAVESQELAGKLGLTGTVVHFNEGWVPFDQRQEFLNDADIGVSTHFDHVETEFSFRTRILDYLWAGLPIVSTAGDSFADLIRLHEAGIVVPPVDEPALEAALERLLFDPDLAAACATASRRLGETLQWSRVLEPLVAFCRDPQRAPDLVDPDQLRIAASNAVIVTRSGGRIRQDVLLLKEYWREGGPGAVVANALKRLRRLVGRLRR
jgi:glycosyltransferase involved in cell wall biosynthesis